MPGGPQTTRFSWRSIDMESSQASKVLPVGRFSVGTLCAGRAEIQHEHVVPRTVLVDAMLAAPRRVPEILASSIACLVTEEEHRRLSAVAAGLQGWDRYRAADVAVVDIRRKRGSGNPWRPSPEPCIQRGRFASDAADKNTERRLREPPALRLVEAGHTLDGKVVAEVVVAPPSRPT